LAALAQRHARGKQVMSDAETFLTAQHFLAREAKLLDERRYDAWLEMLDDDIVYHVPIREARVDFADEHAGGGYRINDVRSLVETRIKRLNSGQAWAEISPSRTLRLFGSLIAERDGDIIKAESALIIYRQRGHDDPGELIPVRRQDQLRLTEGGVKLLRRDAFITEVVLSTPNLGVFI
jgi:3-phenylpropionate/cinnamic acid dioxygenase small subunit